MSAAPDSPRGKTLAVVIPFPEGRLSRPDPPSVDARDRPAAAALPAPVVDLAAYRSSREGPMLDPAA
jgi:hypothetical protein